MIELCPAEQHYHQQDDHDGAEDAAGASSTKSAKSVVAAAAAEQHDQHDNKKNEHHGAPSRVRDAVAARATCAARQWLLPGPTALLGVLRVVLAVATVVPPSIAITAARFNDATGQCE